MQLLVFILTYPLLWVISRLPFPILYGFSDGIFFLVYHLIGYRKKVVRENLRLVFPNRSESERIQIEKKFYRHMCDMFLELIKTMGISKKSLHKRFIFTNLEVLQQLEAEGRSIMVMFPHYASWEWVVSLDDFIQSDGFGIYQPVNNKYFDRLIRKIRAKFGTTLITTKETRNVIAANKRENRLCMYGIISDQSPQISKAHYWGEFMGIHVPMHTGGEMLCKQHDLPAIYVKVEKLKRGYYQGTFVVLSGNPAKVPDYQITDAFFKLLETSIKEAPELYFWTHKRWKHRGKEEVAKNLLSKKASKF